MPDFIRPAPDEKNPDSSQREQNQKLSRIMNDLLRRGDVFRDEVGKFKIRDSRLDGAGLGTFLELDDSWFTPDSTDTTITDYNVRFDDLGGYSGLPGADALVATLAGWYYLSCQARFEGMDGLISISLVLNGTTVLVKDTLKTGNIDAFLNAGTAYYLSVGDAITLVIRQETGLFQQPDLFRLNFVFLGADAAGTRVTLTASQAILNSTSNQVLSGFTVQRDDLAAYSAGHPTRLTAPADGWYLLSARAVLSTAVATLFYTGFRRSGTLFMGEVSTASRSVNCDNWYQTAYYLTAGQYVEVGVNQVSTPAGTKSVTEAQFGMVQLKGDAGVAGVGTPRGTNLTLTSNVSLAGLGDTLIDTYTTVNHDDLIGYDLGTPERITIPRSGWHVITGTIRFNSLVSCRVTLSVVLNGATTLAQYTAGTVTQLNNPITASYYLYAGDYLELYAGQDSGSPFNATSAFFTVSYVGASSSLSTGTNESSLALNVIQSLLDGGYIVQTGVGVWEFANNGNVVGPVSSTSNRAVVWDGTTGKLVKDSTFEIRPGVGIFSDSVAPFFGITATGDVRIRMDTTTYSASISLAMGTTFLDFNNAGITTTGVVTGVGSGLTTLNASNVSSGTLADARLSANVPLKNAQNTFTASATPYMTLDAGAIGHTMLLVRGFGTGSTHTADLVQWRDKDGRTGSITARGSLIAAGGSTTLGGSDLDISCTGYAGLSGLRMKGGDTAFNSIVQFDAVGSMGIAVGDSSGNTIHFKTEARWLWSVPFARFNGSDNDRELYCYGQFSTATNRFMAGFRAIQTDTADATRTSQLRIGAFYITTFQEGIRVQAGSTYAWTGTPAGGSTSFAKIGGSLFVHFADQGNGTTVETDLYSDTTPASVLGTNGERIEAEYGGLFVSSATATRQIKLYFAGTAIFDSGALTLSLSSAWTMYVTITRVSSSVVRYMISMTTEGAALAAYTSVGELTGLTLSSTNILKVTGQASGVGAATNDIVAKLGSVDWTSAP